MQPEKRQTTQPEGCRHLAKDSRVELSEWFFEKK